MTPAERAAISETQEPIPEDLLEMLRMQLRAAGGPGSGNFGHAGRPGEVGGSAPGDGAARPTPIRVQTVEEAVPLILSGKTVELPDIRSVNTVLTRLGAMALEAKALGKDAPKFDLCQVSVPGTNLFCGSKLRTDEFPTGIPRLQMPVIPGKLKEDFVADLLTHGIASQKETIPASNLKASQAELMGPHVAQMMLSPDFDPAKSPIFVSRDNYVVDGHHRWAAVVGKDAEDNKLGSLTMNVVRLDAPISEIYHKAKAWQRRMGIESRGVD